MKGESENRFPSIRSAIEHFRKLDPEIIDQDIPGFVIVRNGEAVAKVEDQHALIFSNFRGIAPVNFQRRCWQMIFRILNERYVPK